MMKQLQATLFKIAFLFLPIAGICQNAEKVSFNPADAAGGYYMAVMPASNHITGTLLILNTFRQAESMLAESKLHNITSANNLLTIYLSMGAKLYADTAAVNRINAVVEHAMNKYQADTSQLIIGGFDFGGTIALRYTELSYEQPTRFPVHPKAVFAAASFVDLFGLWHWCERQVKKNPGANTDGKILLDMLTKSMGSVTGKPEVYKNLTPFNAGDDSPGNEQYLKNIPVRLYYDTDIAWQLTAKHNSLYDTNIPDGSELIERLLTMGNSNAEFIAAKQPGIRANGVRSASAASIVDENDCVQWVKEKLNIFDPANPLAWESPYKLPTPNGWRTEHSLYPPPFAPGLSFTGMEDIRFSPGWANVKSEDYWSYEFLLWLDGKPFVDAKILQNDLKRYYEGLIAGSVSPADIKTKNISTEVTLKKAKTDANDLETYTGTVLMLDYMTLNPIKLNCVIHVRVVQDKKHSIIIIELSPQPVEHKIWLGLDAIKNGFGE